MLQRPPRPTLSDTLFSYPTVCRSGVVTFYHDFRRQATGRHVVKLCRAESCQARGAAAVEGALADRLDTAMGSTRTDGQVTLEAVYRSEEHTSELQSLMRISYAVFCLKQKNKTTTTHSLTIKR